MNDNSFFDSFTARDLIADKAVGFDAFLRDEGLELLRAYRSIENESVRRSLRNLIAKIAAEEDSSRKRR